MTTQLVAECAQSCLESFQQCLHKAASVHPRDLSLVEDQLARFSIWAANIKALAVGRASLDHRLREALETRDLVIGLLEALELQIKNCSSVIDASSATVKPGDKSSPIDELDQAVEEIASEISLLYKFTNTIRKASKSTQDQKAAKVFQIRDDEGNNIETFLSALFSNHIRDRFPGASPFIQQRLATSMLLRRKRMLYRRSRYEKNPIRPYQTPAPKPIAPQLQVRSAKNPDQTPHVLSHDPQPQVTVTEPRVTAQSVACTATTLAPENFQKASTPSVVSAPNTVALGNHEELRFPAPPCGYIQRKYDKFKRNIEEDYRILSAKSFRPSSRSKEIEETLATFWKECIGAIGEITCPFCFCTLPVNTATNERKWRSHVTDDLDPYVCLFDTCDSAETLYSHSGPWLKHMRDHCSKWRCTAKSHGEWVGATKDEYLDHMNEVHPGMFNKAQISVLADRNGRNTGPLFTVCPLCGIENVDGEMEPHIVGHMRSLALRSLPSYEEDPGRLSELGIHKGAESVVTSTPRSRSTVGSDLDSARSLTFSQSESIAPYTTGASKYEAWGGFHRYLSQFPIGDGLPTLANRAPYPAETASRPVPEQNFEPPPFWESEVQGRFDPSVEFIDDALFEGISDKDRRLFEWGFVLGIGESHWDPQTDPVLNNLRNFPTTMRQRIGMDPDCAVCHAPAPFACKCEARALDAFMAHAEHTMMGLIYKDIRAWVFKRTKNLVKNNFAAEEQGFIPETSRENDEEASKPPSGTHSPQHDKVSNNAHANPAPFPEILDYYYSLVDLTLPPDDDPLVKDPPLSALNGLRRGQRTTTASMSSRREANGTPPKLFYSPLTNMSYGSGDFDTNNPWKPDQLPGMYEPHHTYAPSETGGVFDSDEDGNERWKTLSSSENEDDEIHERNDLSSSESEGA